MKKRKRVLLDVEGEEDRCIKDAALCGLTTSGSCPL